MCGICGIYSFNSRHSSIQGIVRKMMKVLVHRGPDESNFLQKGPLSVGFTRLKINDLKNGMQPILNEDKTITLICNGEIYNHNELRNELLNAGHIFGSNVDVEVIVHLYEEYGEQLLNRLNGQFAFVLYDERSKKLFCARDQVGICPFFYTFINGSFVFASEIKAILEHPRAVRNIDLETLDQIMTFPGAVAPNTMFEGISSLENGHYLIIEDNKFFVKEYWDLKYPSIDEQVEVHGENYYIEKLDYLLDQAVKMRLKAEIPVGFYISGGLDSALIASKVTKFENIHEIPSFSLDVEGKGFSERKYQQLVQDRIKSKHYEQIFSVQNLCDYMEQVIYHSETMLKESYNTASFMLSNLVHEKHIKAVLTGEGADELFAGYVGYRFDQIRSRQNIACRDCEKLLRERIWGDSEFYYEKDYSTYTEIKKQMYSRNMKQQFDEFNCLRKPVINKDRIRKIDLVHKRSYVDYKLRLPEHLLANHGDRMAMAHSVECRYPFLDKEVMEFSRFIPANLKLKNLTEKYILKQIAKGHVPQEVVNRPKFPFVTPGSVNILKQNNEYIHDMLSYEKIKKDGYFDADKVENLKVQYLQDGFQLNLPYDTDYLILVLTFSIFKDIFKISSL